MDRMNNRLYTLDMNNATNDNAPADNAPTTVSAEEVALIEACTKAKISNEEMLEARDMVVEKFLVDFCVEHKLARPTDEMIIAARAYANEIVKAQVLKIALVRPELF